MRGTPGSRFLMAAGLLAGLVGPGQVQPGFAQPGGAAVAASASVAGTEIQEVLARYCQACHNQRSTVGRETGLAFDALDIGAVAPDAQRWEHVVRRLRNGSMPPAGRPRPAADTYDRVATWIETRLDAAADASPDPGRPAVLHRLNRAEYRNAVRDLLALDVDVSSLLPSDTSSYGFDNIGDVLGLSPLLLESYLAAANRISRLAVASDSAVAVAADVYRVSTELTQRHRLDGLPFGTRGGTLISHAFPVDGEYEIRVRLARNGASGNGGDIVGLREPHRVEIAVDGVRAGLLTAGADLSADDSGGAASPPAAGDANLRVRVPVQAGPRQVAVSFLRRPAAQVERTRRPFLRALLEHDRTHELPYVSEVIVTGPYRPAVPDSTPSRDRVFICRPESGATAERACAERILSGLARRAFRRPAAAADLRVLLPFYEAGHREGGFERGIEQALARLLVSPSFLFRIELDPVDAASGRAYPVDDLALASRLSFFLWSSIPDEQLLGLAERDELSDPDVLERQVSRMLADPRADALADNFAGQWLYLRNVPAARPDFRRFPDVDDNLRRAFRRETELLFESIVREDRSAIDLLAADYTFVNERLARHYDIPHVYGDHFRRVSTLDHPMRGGLLGQGSMLTVQSLSTRTSPVKRGIWILENILGTTPPDPPPDVPELEASATDGRELSMREAMERHRANPTCAACHRLMDPLGLALENFDAVGRWRETDASGASLDVSGELPDGTRFVGVAELKRALLANPEPFLRTLTERLLTYALGRGLEYTDAPAVRRIVRDAASREHRFSALVLGIVKSVPFRQRRSAGAAPAAGDAD